MNIFYQNRQENFQCFISKNNTYPVHLHRQIEILYVIEGSIQTTIDKETRGMEKGDIAFIFPSICHSYFTPQNSSILLIFFDIEFCSDFTGEFFHYIPSNPVIKGNLLNSETKYILNFFRSASQNSSCSAPICRGYLTVLLAYLFPFLALKENTYIYENSICQKLLFYIDRHFKEHLTLEVLSKEIGMSPFYISHIFSDKIHQSFPEYLNYRRIESACMLLYSTTGSVTQIAYDCGFSSIRSFYRAFHAVCHTTPKEYRNQKRKEQQNLT